MTRRLASCVGWRATANMSNGMFMEGALEHHGVTSTFFGSTSCMLGCDWVHSQRCASKDGLVWARRALGDRRPTLREFNRPIIMIKRYRHHRLLFKSAICSAAKLSLELAEETHTLKVCWKRIGRFVESVSLWYRCLGRISQTCELAGCRRLLNLGAAWVCTVLMHCWGERVLAGMDPQRLLAALGDCFEQQFPGVKV